MPSVDRAAVTRLIYERLADPGFRRHLECTDPDGTHPIVVALRDDLMVELVDKVRAAGGAANVVVPALNGFMVLDMSVEPTADTGAGSEVQTLAPDCTVGLFVTRLHVDDEGARYQLSLDDDPASRRSSGRAAQASSTGRAKVVALGS